MSGSNGSRFDIERSENWSKTSVTLMNYSHRHRLCLRKFQQETEAHLLPASQAAQWSARVLRVNDTLTSGVLKQVRRVRFISDWIDDHAATRQAHKLRETYAPLVAKAEQAEDWGERDRLLSAWRFESDSVLDPVYERKGERLTAKARRHGIIVPSQPRNNDEQSEDWRLSRVYGFWLPSAQLEQKLRREIKIEQGVNYDEFRKWATLSFAFAGFLLAFYSVRATKRPDPCPRNYYRSDSGECIFALQKSPQPSKPSPMRESARARP
jgi:hypothetical protein